LLPGGAQRTEALTQQSCKVRPSFRPVDPGWFAKPVW